MIARASLAGLKGRGGWIGWGGMTRRRPTHPRFRAAWAAGSFALRARGDSASVTPTQYRRSPVALTEVPDQPFAHGCLAGTTYRNVADHDDRAIYPHSL